MSIHSNHTDPDIRRRANQLLRQAGYDVRDPQEPFSFFEYMAHRHAVGVSWMRWRTAAMLSTGITIILLGALVYFGTQPKVVYVAPSATQQR